MTKKEEKQISVRIRRAQRMIEKRIKELEKKNDELHSLGGDLAGCVVFALNNLTAQGSGLMMIGGRIVGWETRFIEVLGTCGVKVVRKKR